ncbi:hypothetical protein Hanom_Chr09g00773761 [Helianthus anomalus]
MRHCTCDLLLLILWFLVLLCYVLTSTLMEQVANVVLNSSELDQTVAALTVAAHHLGHREGYTDGACNVKTMMRKD